MQENLKAKYGITAEELKRAVDQIQFGKIACDGVTLCAVIDLVANGDIAGTAKPEIIFKSSEHELFYNEMLAKCTYQDCYHRALMYTLGINEDTRRHINEIYDFGERCVKVASSLKAGWITSGTARALRLAFNLFLDEVPEKGSRDRYSVGEIFNHGDAEYFFQAIKLRFEY